LTGFDDLHQQLIPLAKAAVVLSAWLHAAARHAIDVSTAAVSKLLADPLEQAIVSALPCSK
jgi:hypothetical protein